MRKLSGLGVLLPSLTLLLALQQTSPAQSTSTSPATTTYVKAGYLFDSEAGAYRQNVVLVLAGDRIQSV
jgi:hypothetical protein